ncbi:MAG TPA: hypothetical protein VHA74_01710 [Candidatus Dojkabacteria bacterium]|nr:hypothetical protein [Candidatus Dojkabacteria bacterium]
MNKPVCITFAAPVGSSKSPIANYLSWNLDIPVFNKDPIQTELQENLLKVDVKDDFYNSIVKERTRAAFAKKRTFIYDASVDRVWGDIKELAMQNGYECFVISITLTKERLVKMYEVKGYLESLKRIDQLIEDHKKFLEQYSSDVSLTIDDDNFMGRLELCLNEATAFLKKN